MRTVLTAAAALFLFVSGDALATTGTRPAAITS